MCYRVYQHTLVHDARPTVQWCNDEAQNTRIINPYADPRPCHCTSQDPTIAVWLRCSFGHKCCYLVSHIVRCTNTINMPTTNFKKTHLSPPIEEGHLQHCAELTPYHTYTPAQSVFNKQDRPDNVYGSENDEGWYPWPVLDGQIGRLENRQELFPSREETIAKMSRAILKCETRLKKLDAELQHLERRDDSNDACSQILSAKDCLRNFKELDEDLLEVETRLAIKRMLFDAIAFGFAGKRSHDTLFGFTTDVKGSME